MQFLESLRGWLLGDIGLLLHLVLLQIWNCVGRALGLDRNWCSIWGPKLTQCLRESALRDAFILFDCASHGWAIGK